MNPDSENSGTSNLSDYQREYIPAESVEDNTVKILVATDNHLGFAEKEAIRGDDSFIAFEEMLQYANEKEVDFILLGGDLFHDSKPTVNTLHRCMALLRHYCMGGRPIHIEFLSDPSENFEHSANPTVNYMDPNLNVSIPVFSIHGNHDDPSGYNSKCSLDMLSSAGLVNYFGRTTDLTQITISPILLRKGTTKIAIYGLGSVKDTRLYRLFREEKVFMLRPETDPDSWFNILVLHQNHASHNKTGFVPESFLPEFIDLVIWGHEHECLIKPNLNPDRQFYVTQPGSSVATSLCEAEAKPKHVGLLKVLEKKFRITPLPLLTVRPFVFASVNLAEINLQVRSTALEAEVQRYLERKVENLLEEAQNQITNHPKQPNLPLIRLRVEFSRSEEMFNLVRFGLQYQDQVANPSDMVTLKRRLVQVRGPSANDVMDQNAIENLEANPNLHGIEELVENYFKECDHTKQLTILDVKRLNEASSQFMNKDDRDAILDTVKMEMKNANKHMIALKIDKDEIELAMERYREERARNAEIESQEFRNMLLGKNRLNRVRIARPAEDDEMIVSDEDGASASTATSKQVGRGRGRGRGRATSGAKRGRGAARMRVDPDDDDDVSIIDDDEDDEFPTTRGRGRGKASRARMPKAARGGRKTNGSSTKVSNSFSMAKLDITSDSSLSSMATQPKRGIGRMAFLDDSDLSD